MKYFAVANRSKRDCSGIKARAIISSGTRDLAGTIVKQDGIICPDRVSLLSSHDDRTVIGYANEFAIEDGKTMATIVIMSLEHASLVRNKALLGISVGLDVLEGEDRPGGTITKSQLLELSLTPVPANQEAMILVDTIQPFCLVEEGKQAKQAEIKSPTAKNKAVRTANNRLTRQVKHYRGAVKAKLSKLKNLVTK